MQGLSKRSSVIAGFTLLLVLVALNAVVIAHQLGIQIANHNQVLHSQQVRFELSRTETLIESAETGQRGFLYTEDPKYIADYRQSVGQINSAIDALNQSTIDNTQQQARIAQLRTLVSAKLAELARTISLEESGDPALAMAIVKSDQGFTLMSGIRKLLDEMAEEEQSLSNARLEAYRRSVRITTLCIYAACFAAGLGVVLLGWHILRAWDSRDRIARQIEEREEWFRATLTNLGDAVIATDSEGLVTFLNPIAEQLTGRSLADSNGRKIDEVFPIFNETSHRPVENPVQKVMESGKVVGLANHTILQRPDGSFVPIEDSAAPIRNDEGELVGVVLVFRDATHERKAQELMRKSEKLAAAARLAATVAHEINNPLEAVGNLLYIVKTMPDVPSAAAEYFESMERELERVAHLARQTLGFYRESKVPEEVGIAALIETILKVYVTKLANKSIRIETDLQPCPPVLGLAGELRQVIANLISNAIDAVPENGAIRVRLRCIDAERGKVAEVSVEDNGSGIREEHMAKIFEPFFTTKKDVGTGLGLWVTKEIVERHGGGIQVISRSKGFPGTSFSVNLPLFVGTCKADGV